MRWFYWLRTFIFYIFFGAWTVVWPIWVILTIRAVPLRWRHCYAVVPYSFIVVWLCRLICGIRWRIEGRENIPKVPCSVAANHQSTWETFFLQCLFTPQATVLKQELLKVPFFGWALKALNPISIDRNNRRDAMKTINTRGAEALHNGLWVMSFPEGTRQPWPTLGRYARGAATLASKADTPLLPIVHNAGHYWPNKKWLKTPGEIIIRIGPIIVTADKTVKAINDELEAWSRSNNPV